MENVDYCAHDSCKHRARMESYFTNYKTPTGSIHVLVQKSKTYHETTPNSRAKQIGNSYTLYASGTLIYTHPINHHTVFDTSQDRRNCNNQLGTRRNTSLEPNRTLKRRSNASDASWNNVENLFKRERSSIWPPRFILFIVFIVWCIAKFDCGQRFYWTLLNKWWAKVQSI